MDHFISARATSRKATTPSVRSSAGGDGGVRDHRVESPIATGLDHYRDVPAFGVLQHAAETLPQRNAVRYGNQAWTFRELNRDAVRCAAMFQARGVRPGDRVGLLLPNVPEFIIAANAAWRAGAIVVAISPLMVAEEVHALLRQTKCKHVVCLDLLSDLVETPERIVENTWLVSIRQHLPAHRQLGYLWARHRRTHHWSIFGDGQLDWFWNAIEETTGRWRPISIQTEYDPAYILPTGGTTGHPKAVTLSHQNMVANAWQQYAWTERSFGREKMLAVLPFFHSYGVSATVMGGAMMGASLVLHHRFNATYVIQLIRQHRPTVMHAVPAMLVAMNERLRDHQADLSSLKWVISGGAPLEESTAREFASHTGALVVEGFGLSEASPVTHVGHLFREPRYGTIGLPLPETDCRIIDAEAGDWELPAGKVGELAVRGPQVMLGYWMDREATADAIRDGWLRTGDLAVREKDGVYRIVGRKKDLIITSGYNVFPSEVEAVLCQANDVSDAAVVGYPDKRRGEIVKAFVVLESGGEWDEESLREHCRKWLSSHKCPRIFERVDGDLPRNFLGKIIRRQLREAVTFTGEPDDLSLTQVSEAS